MKKTLFLLCITMFIFAIFIISINNPVYAYNSQKTDDIQNNRSGGNNEYGYYNIGTSLPYAVDYSGSDLLRFLKPGDLIYEDGGSSSFTGHSAIVEGIFYDSVYCQYYVRMIEAMPDYGVCRSLMSPQRFSNEAVSIYRLDNASSTQINAAVSFCISQLGKPYSLDWLCDYSSSNPDWYCSELVWAAYYNQSIFLANAHPYIYPSDIRDYPHAKMIVSLNVSTWISNITNSMHTIACGSSINPDEFTESHNFVSENCCYDICTVCYYEKQIANHSLNYLWLDYTQHRAYCNCGFNQLQGHAVSQGYFNPGQQYATCLVCGGLASIGFINPFSINVSPTTKNGSYILPNGVIALAEKDVEAYFNGTLEFNSCGILIEKDYNISLYM